jgi:hypothetical protein
MSTVYTPDTKETFLFEEADRKYEQIKQLVVSEDWASKPHDEVERLVESMGREVLLQLYGVFVNQRAQCQPAEEQPLVGSDQIERRHRRERARKISCIFGTVCLERTGYSARGTTSLFPVDSDLNLPKESYSLELRRRAAQSAVYCSFDETTRLLREATGTKIGKRQVLELVQRAAQDFEEFYLEREAPLPDESSDVLVVSFDRKGVIVRHQDLREKTRKAAQENRPKLEKRRTSGQRRNRKRMAGVAAVYTLAPWRRTAHQVIAGLRGQPPTEEPLSPRPKPKSKRLWASVSNQAERVVEQAFEEALARDPHQEKHWVVLVDGDAHQLYWFKKAAKRHGVKMTIVLDIIHVIEYLWIAAHAFCGAETKEAEQWVGERLKKVLEGKAGWVAGGMRRSAKLRNLPTAKRNRVAKCADYLKKYSCYLRYDEALEAGFSIGTGVIEGACRYLIGDRLDITGARWSLEGAEAVLRLRALRGSGDFDAYWEFHTQKEYERNHGSRYATGEHPELVRPQGRSHLRLIKS